VKLDTEFAIASRIAGYASPRHMRTKAIIRGIAACLLNSRRLPD